jgi:hypothetical protein
MLCRWSGLLAPLTLLWTLTAAAATQYELLTQFRVGPALITGVTRAADGTLYGTTSLDFRNLRGVPGTVYKRAPDGTVTYLHYFEFNDVANGNDPEAGVTLAPDGSLYWIPMETSVSCIASTTIFLQTFSTVSCR